MLRWLRDWWTLQSKSAQSPEYDDAMERRMPGFKAIQRQQATDAAERHRREEAWWQSVVALQEAGRIEAVEAQVDADAGELNKFVLDPTERLAMLYGREVDRLLALGDRVGATRAADHAISLMLRW